ncbi:MFS transporter [Methylobacterium sp. JK268]
MPASRQFRLLTLHCVATQASTSLAGGFVGAYLLTLGLSLPAALAVYASVLGVRFALRFAVLPLVRRIGLRPALILGVVIGALQFWPLAFAQSAPGWLAAWIATVALSEALYWPVLHAASAVTAGGDTRGRQIATRQLATALVAVAAPLLGGLVLTRLGPSAEFGLAGLALLTSALPITQLGRIAAGPVPSWRDSVRAVDPVGLLAFAADGWIASGLGLAWPMILFATLGARFDAFAWSGSLAAFAGAIAGLVCGRAIDAGRRGTTLAAVSVALTAVVAARAGASAWPAAAHVANALGAAVNGLYVPVIMSAVYERAKQSGSAYRFHLGAESGWDLGAIGGCLSGAAVAAVASHPSLAVLPAALGILAMAACVSERPAPGPEAAVTV